MAFSPPIVRLVKEEAGSAYWEGVLANVEKNARQYSTVIYIFYGALQN